jgi:hypothetical protein
MPSSSRYHTPFPSILEPVSPPFIYKWGKGNGGRYNRLASRVGWEEVVHEGSAYFPDGRIKIEVGVRVLEVEE